MNGDHQGDVLSASLLRLLPDVFSHPSWVQFFAPQAALPKANLDQILRAAEDLGAHGEWLDSGQLLLLCAALQSRAGDHAAALTSAQQVQALAERHDLPSLAWWADWAAGALHLRRGDRRQAAWHLRNLETELNDRQEWVLANIVGVIEDTLFDQGQPLPDDGRSILPGASAELSSRHALAWLQHWGEPPAMLRGAGAGRDRPDLNGQPFAGPGTALALRSSTLAVSPNASAVRRGARATLAVCCLGVFRAYLDDRLVQGWPGRKPLSVFKYLLLSHPAPVPKEVLMDIFWPDLAPEAARRSLHQAIYSLRQTFKRAGRQRPVIQFEDDHYALDQGLDVWLDFHQFEAHVDAGRRLEAAGRNEAAMVEYGLAKSLYQGDLLEGDLYEEWPHWLREQARQTYLVTADRLAEYYVQREEWPAAIALCHRILARDHCHERAHARLMRCYMAQGERYLAIRQYHVCVEALRTELDLSPSPEIVSLYHEIVAQQVPA